MLNIHYIHCFVLGINSINHGTAAFVSFHHTKPVGFGEGGAIIIDKKYEAAVLQCVNFGYDVPKGNVRWLPQGSNFKMSDVQAAFIYAYLDTFQDIVKAQKSLYEKLKCAIVNLGIDIKLLPNFSSATPFTSCFPILFGPSIEEDFIKLVANEDSIDIRKYYKPLVPVRGLAPVSHDIYDRIVCFPCHTQMKHEDISKVLSIVQKIYRALNN